MRPKPTYMHRPKGNYRSSRHGDRLNPEPEGELMAPPGWLSPAQKKRFQEILQDAPVKLLRRWAASLLAAYVVAEDTIAQANEARQTEAGRHLLERNSDRTLTIAPLLKLQARFLPNLRQ